MVGKNIPDKELVEEARDSMFHRGPDDAGLYYSRPEGVALGHRRLSIIDLSPTGHQPFFSNDGRYVIIFNGEIYNYLEIKKELKGRYDFKTPSDTEVLIAAYSQWGKGCLEKINGMFAFAIWDKKENSLFVARDRLGIKPLYYSIVSDNFYFASEIKAILKLSKIRRELNKQGYLDYLSYRQVLGGDTFFVGISALLPGHCLFFKKHSVVEQTKYWDLPVLDKKNDPGEEQILKNTEELLKETVRQHLISDVPLGAYLSGGLDSSLLVALIAGFSKEKVKTFTVGFEEVGYNEFEPASQVANLFDTDHHEIILKGQEYLSLIPEVIKIKDEPLSIPNEIAVHLLSKELKKHISVVLSGEGADELFGGYGRIFRSGFDWERMQLLKSGQLNSSDAPDLVNNLRDKYGDWQEMSEIEHFLRQYQYFDVKEKEQILNQDFFSLDRNSIINKPFFVPFFDKLKNLSVSDKYLHIFQKIHLLAPMRRLDANTMSSSVEARVPFVDHKLVEFVSALPLHYKLAWKSEQQKEKARSLNSSQISEEYDTTKYLLKKIAEKYLPDNIINRKKIGFPVPLNSFFGEKFKDFSKEILLSDDSRSKAFYNQSILEKWLDRRDLLSDNRWGYSIWMLINMELWLREYNVYI